MSQSGERQLFFFLHCIVTLNVLKMDYNQLKSGVDTLDQVVHCYSVKRKMNRWSFALFCYLVDIEAYNSFVLFTRVHPEYNRCICHRRQTFSWNVAIASAGSSTSCSSISGASYGAIGGSGPMRPLKRCCHLCARTIDRKFSQQCECCQKAVCNEHSRRVCANYNDF